MSQTPPRNPREILTLPSPPATARIPYGPGEHHFGDLRLPATAGPHPVVILIHGGFWRAAYDLAYAGHMAADLATHGFASWNIEYRRIGHPGGGYPGTLEDVAAALTYLRTLATKYNLNLHRLFVIGHSAGGHLALWLATGGAKLPMHGVLAIAPVADLRDAHQRSLGQGVVGDFMGCTPASCPAAYREASPAERLPVNAPVRLLHGRQDDIVPFAMSEAFAKAAGGNTQLIPLPSGHFEPVDPRTPEWDTVRQTLLTLAKAK